MSTLDELELIGIPATFMRGGTSKGVMILEQYLPADRADWTPILLGIMGSPDTNARQLDGMGGGISSLSKVCVISAAPDDEADINYTFVQVSVAEASIDFSSNCGNMSSAVGPFALEEGLVTVEPDAEVAVVRIRNTNTDKIIVSTFPVKNSRLKVSGTETISGVAGSAAPIQLAFQNPGGAKTGKILPSGNALDVLSLADGSQIEASIVDAANPCVFVRADDLGIDGHLLPEEYDADTPLMSRLEMIRQAASVVMGLTSNLDEANAQQALPKVAFVQAPKDAKNLAGEVLPQSDIDLTIRMLSMGNVHRAIPVTGALCAAAGQILAGTILNRLSPAPKNPGRLSIGHPSGVIGVVAEVSEQDPTHVVTASIYRTTRKLFKGEVYYRG